MMGVFPHHALLDPHSPDNGFDSDRDCCDFTFIDRWHARRRYFFSDAVDWVISDQSPGLKLTAEAELQDRTEVEV